MKQGGSPCALVLLLLKLVVIAADVDCSTIADPCACNESCGWDSDLNSCVVGSTTNCHECPTISEICIYGVCQDFGCPSYYNHSLVCQCTESCVDYGNCCKDVGQCWLPETGNLDITTMSVLYTVMYVVLFGGAFLLICFLVGIVIWFMDKDDSIEEDFSQASVENPVPVPNYADVGGEGDAENALYSDVGNLRAPLLSQDSLQQDRKEGVKEHKNGLYDSFGNNNTPRGTQYDLDASKIELLEPVGHGNFGDVFKAKFRGALVAVKKFKDISGVGKQNALKEAAFLATLRFEFLVTFVGIVHKPDQVWIVTGYYGQGSVDQILKDRVVPMEQKYKWLYQAACGLDYLHDKKYAHRDLAIRNLLVGDNGNVVISDFGLSRTLREKADRRKTIMTSGPVRWMAPESLTKHEYSIQSDMWMFGVMVWEMMNDGALPYENLRNQEILPKVAFAGLRLAIGSDWPPMLGEAAQQCWLEDPSKRITAEEFQNVLEDITTQAMDKYTTM